MFRLKDFFLAVVLVFFAMSTALAQTLPTIPVSTGSKTGSYYKFMTQVKEVCPEVPLSILESTGTAANFDALENNDVAIAPGQMDVANLYKQTPGKDMSNLKLLMPLFPEQVHFITRSDVTKTEGGFNLGSFNVGGNKTQLRTVADLAGKQVASAGGSVLSAKMFVLQSGINLQVVDVGSSDKAIAEMLAGKYDAAVLVGAAPLGTITGTKEAPNPRLKDLRLLEVPGAIIDKMTVFRRSQPLSYRGMGEGGNNVQSVEVMSGLFTQNYPKSTMGDAVYALQQCLLRNAQDQATIPGRHPAWRNLRMTTGLNWDLWQYAGAGQATQAPVSKKK